MSKKASKESKLSRYLKAPLKILIKARDFYIKSMTEYSDRINYGTVMGCPTGQVNTLPRSYSVSSAKSSNGDDDLRELIRAASTRSLGNKVQLDLLRRQQARQSPVTGANNVPRSHSVGIGRIDEDKPCDFEEDIKVKTDALPRSRSYAVAKRNGAFF
ncbi:hypothetical protein QUC31_003269 [Theobroma cacao]|uniref:Uncharacterized protein LOC18611312 n=1 Tax=Theobroma cacao TaxID=3641 RepID=A0AB32VX11_THECC|nr:PREDICTED: uncharacterized protein LOC18611312 [Theobroma cacao]WRX08429.1 hypothetical protein QQP08_000916 [Theobroma cacao]